MDAEFLIRELGLAKLPEEGGFFREVYRARETVPGAKLGGRDRVASTDIYYLMTPEEFSGLHRVKTSIEIWNFYLGDPVDLIQIDEVGNLTHTYLGPDISAGQRPKTIVSAGVWQGAQLVEGGKWALVGCTCVPGFEFEDFEVDSRAALSRRFPRHAEMIHRYTREEPAR